MLIKNITEMYDADYNISDIFSMTQNWKEGSVFKMPAPRPTACLLYLVGCDAVYRQNGKTFTAEKNSIVYIPMGSIYETQFINCNACACILIEFNLVTAAGERFNLSDRITVLTENVDPLIIRLFGMAADLFLSTVIATPKLKSVIYDILTELSNIHRKQKIYSKKYKCISHGISLLYSGKELNKSIEEIAKECNVSSATFRRLFKEYSGISPAQYRTSAQIEYAKKLICTGTMTVSEIAIASGFTDCAYFCRVFKRKTGLTPSEYGNTVTP